MGSSRRFKHRSNSTELGRPGSPSPHLVFAEKSGEHRAKMLFFPGPGVPLFLRLLQLPEAQRTMG